MTDRPRYLDVSELPTVVFGRKSIMTWGTVAFMVIEGMVLAIGVVAYLYLARRFESWPPPTIAPPELWVGAAGVLLHIGSLYPAIMAAKAAEQCDARRVRNWFVVSSAVILLLIGWRALEFARVNVRWDTTAYGSVIWTLLGLHATLLVIEAVEVWGVTGIFVRGKNELKHYADAADVAFYWWFLVASWIPLSGLIYVGTRIP